MRTLLALPVLLALVACTGADSDTPTKVDSDGDGLGDAQEEGWGSDPNNPDTDGDGLWDGDEYENNSDPNNTDTDGDGYGDNDEVNEGTDPADASSMIYVGGWPYQPDKDAFGDVSWSDAAPEKDSQLPRFQFVDQFGDYVDIYDYAGHGVPIVLDISAEWCPPCQGMAQWLSGGRDSYGYGSSWPNVPAAVENGDVYWVTIIEQSNSGGLASQETVADWYESYPDPHIAVLAGDGNPSGTYVTYGWPTLFMLDDDMTVSRASFDDYTKTLDKVDALYSGE